MMLEGRRGAISVAESTGTREPLGTGNAHSLDLDDEYTYAKIH